MLLIYTYYTPYTLYIIYIIHIQYYIMSSINSAVIPHPINSLKDVNVYLHFLSRALILGELGLSIFFLIASIAEVGVMMVTTSLVTLVMVLIWQKNVLLAIGFPVLFGSIELTYFSAVLMKVGQGGWLPLAFATCFLLVMYIWNYGSVLKYQSEVRKKMKIQVLSIIFHLCVKLKNQELYILLVMEMSRLERIHGFSKNWL